MIPELFCFKRFFSLQNLLLFLPVSFSFVAHAQLCNGSLGDPIVNITFGAGANPGPKLSAATTNYQYAANACPVNGFYTLLNSGIECNYGWHILKSDHTGNPNGYFMLVDASFEPGDFYLDTVKNLCANTTYEFASWMLNMKYFIQGIRPNITFTIETILGQVLQSYNSGDIPVEQTIIWKQYGFYFTTPANVNKIVLRMTNNAPGGEGNDLALDDITFRPCGQLITASIAGDTSHLIDICEGSPNAYTFNATASVGYQSPVYQWQVSSDLGITWIDITNATGISYFRSPTVSGNYWYRFTEAESGASSSCSIASNLVVIQVHAKPTVDAGPDRNVIRGNAIILNGKAAGDGLTYLWSPDIYISDVTKLSPVVSPVQNIEYTLSARSIYGCTNEDKVQVKVVAQLYIPTAFTPNGDGINDTWEIPFLDPEYDAVVNVYNRYGKVVYHAAGEVVSWDGKFHGLLQPSGTYVYMVTFKASKIILKGTLTLIR
ncbi:MAG: T9SS type B sorting domain-containing protein [Bacteroidota bacterium]|nr:T9SS type B sorting domain-containing protein [Bacteroidota bacterium]